MAKKKKRGEGREGEKKAEKQKKKRTTNWKKYSYCRQRANLPIME